MRAFLVLTLLVVSLLGPATFPITAAAAAPSESAQPAPDVSAQAPTATLKGYILKDIRWSYSNELPTKWTETDIVARGKDITIPNPSTDRARGAIHVSLGLPDTIIINQEFMVEAQVEADPDTTNMWWFSFAAQEIAYPQPYTEAQHSQKLTWFERSYWTPNGPRTSPGPAALMLPPVIGMQARSTRELVFCPTGVAGKS